MIMARSTICTFCLLVLFCCVSQGRANNAFKKINNYLVDNVKSDDPAANLQAVKELLAKETSKKHGLFHVNLQEPLEKFIELTKLKAPDSCNAEGYQISRYNTDATDGEARDNVNPVRRIDKLVRKFATNHAISCLGVYHKKMVEKINKIDHLSFLFVQSFTEPLIRYLKKSLATPYLMEPSKTPITDATVRVNNNPALVWEIGDGYYQTNIYSAIQALAKVKNDPDVAFLEPVADERGGNRKVNREKVNALFQKYALDSCTHFNNYLGPDVLKPFAHEFVFCLDESDEGKHPEFYMNWFRFVLCDNLIKKDNVRMRDALYRLVEYAAYDKLEDDFWFTLSDAIGKR